MYDQDFKTPVYKAGGIILNKNNEVLLLYQIKHNDWTFPKGHIEEGEKPDAAALREVDEETGLSPIILKELPILNYTNRNNEYSETHMYLMQCEDDKDLKEEYEGNKLLWVQIDKVVDRLSFDNLKEYFKKIQSLINI